MSQDRVPVRPGPQSQGPEHSRCGVQPLCMCKAPVARLFTLPHGGGVLTPCVVRDFTFLLEPGHFQVPSKENRVQDALTQ